MLPHGVSHQLYHNFAVAAAALIAHQGTPGPLRRKINTLIEGIREELPDEALPEIEAAEAEAVIKAAAYLPLSAPDS